MKRNNGFTLVELLATMVILAIIMLVAVPNVTGIIARNKAKTYVEDAKKLVTTAEYKIRTATNSVRMPATGHCIILTLTYLDNGEFEDPPYGGEYQKDD